MPSVAAECPAGADGQSFANDETTLYERNHDSRIASSRFVRRAAADDRPWIVDRFDDIKVIRYEVPGFENLPLEQKELVYYLSEAAKCGRDILYDQNCPANLPVRRTLEVIYENYRGDRTTPEWKALEKYLKKVWFANGIHHHYSNDKFTPEFTEGYLLDAIETIPRRSSGR